jgi:hypothetical protein
VRERVLKGIRGIEDWPQSADLLSIEENLEIIVKLR